MSSTILELYLHPNSRKILPDFQAIRIIGDEYYLVDVDPYPQTLFIRRAVRCEIALLDGPQNSHHNVIRVVNGRVRQRHPSFPVCHLA
jgi:hypothetical protein